jgi:hypothetical protein
MMAMKMKTVENKSQRMVLLRLNSGNTLFIGSGMTLEVPALELERNRLVEKLLERRIILVHDGATKKAAGSLGKIKAKNQGKTQTKKKAKAKVKGGK